MKNTKLRTFKNWIRNNKAIIFLIVIILGSYFLFSLVYIAIQINQYGGDVAPTFSGRIGVSSDGNQHDPDDIGASAFSIAIIKAAGAQFVHHDYSNHLGDNDDTMEHSMNVSVTGAAMRFFGGINNTYNCQKELEGAIDNIAGEINASSAEDRFYYVCGGPMEVPYRGIMKSDPDKRQYCTVISHSDWNDYHADTSQMTHTWDDIVATGVKTIRIKSQNEPPILGLSQEGWSLNTRKGWDWMENDSNPDIQWLYSRMKAGAFGDVSDAGMVYYVVTGLGDQNCSPAKLKTLFSEL